MPTKDGNKCALELSEIPEIEIMMLLDTIVPAVRRSMERPDFKEGFEKWKAEKAKKAAQAAT